MKNNLKQNFIEITKKEFQKYSQKAMDEKDIIEIQTNVFSYMELLLTWNKQKKEKP